MIKINFTEPEDSDWKDWRKACNTAAEMLLVAHGSGQLKEIDAKLYKGQKHVYLGLNGAFHGKCAYCESRIGADQPGDIDHYRPKGRVTVNSEVVMLRNTITKHHGYFWLAYDWSNLLPACEDCNRPGKAKTGGKLVGKWDEFPVQSFRAEQPGDEAQEEPLLLHPVNDDPSEHLLACKNGMLVAQTDKGQKTLDLFGLNLREALVTGRKEAFSDASAAIQACLVALIYNDEESAIRHLETIEAFEGGVRAYSCAGREGMEWCRSRIPQGVFARVLGATKAK